MTDKQPSTDDMTTFQRQLLTAESSAFRLYQDMFLGQRGPGYLIKHELIMLLANQTPGALGLVLRKILYPRLFAKSGRNVMFGKNMTIRHAVKMEFGSQVAIDDNVVLDAKGCTDGKHFRLGSQIIIGHTSTLCSKGGSLEIGDHCNFGSHIAVYAASDISFGLNILVGPGSFFGGGTYQFEKTDRPIIGQGYNLKGPISIGDNCWFGAAVTIVDGVTIGHDSIIGAGAVVLEDIPPLSIAAGVPAKVIRSR